jgi:uncharacterized protein DUF2637
MSHASPPVAAARRGRGVVWGAGLLVAIGAGVATAHGLYQVALAAQVPAAIAWLYPLITDGLALVAYAATARLSDAGRRYAWSVVVLAAGLSGLAQATHLTGTVGTGAPVGLRFGVGAWPAIAAAIVAHLLHLLAIRHHTNAAVDRPHGDQQDRSYDALDVAVRPDEPASTSDGGVQPPVQASNASVQPASNPAGAVVQPADAANGAGARDRALAAAREHRSRHGELPTVTQLMALAQVARGTAGNALKTVRAERPALPIVHVNPETRTEQ